MAFPPGFLDELRSRVSLADLVGKRVRLARKGREYGGLCPFHNEKTPSFYVVEDKGFFHCFGCGAHGDAIGFVMRAESLDFIEAIERLAETAGIAVPQQTPQERERAQRQKTLLEALAAAANFYEERLWSPGGARGREYLAARGLDEETMRRFRLGWAPEDRQSLRHSLVPEFSEELLLTAGLLRNPRPGGSSSDYFAGRVMFPIGDRVGRVIAFGARTIGNDQPKYLNSPDTPVFEKGRAFYGLSLARVEIGGEGDIGGVGPIVTEGYMDVIALHRAGFKTALAPLGTALTAKAPIAQEGEEGQQDDEFSSSQLHELWRLAPEPVLCFDGDSAGQRAALRALARALPQLKPGHSLRFVTLPAGEGPDSLIRAGGRIAFEEVLRAARPLADEWWRAELRAKQIDTPERRADLEKRLMDQIGDIADRTVQYEYRRFFRNKLFELGRLPRRTPVRMASGRPMPTIVLNDAAPPPPPLPGRRQRELLIGMLLEHPFLIAEAHEDIAALDFPEPELDKLRRTILEVDATSEGLDAEALRQHLGLSGFAMTADAAALILAEHGGSLRSCVDAGAVRNWWGHLVRMLRDSDKGKSASAGNAPGHDLTEPGAWERFLALQGREAQEGFSEDEFPPGRAEGLSPR